MCIVNITKLMEDANDSNFYNFIVGITRQSSQQNILARDVQTIANVIIKDYKKNVHLAAMRGLTKAYICIYEVGARYKGIIPIDELVRMTTTTREKLEAFKIEPVLSIVRKKLAPFFIGVGNLSENEIQNDSNIPNVDDTMNSIIRTKDSDDLSELAQDINPDTVYKNNLIGIFVSWDNQNIGKK